MYYIDISITIIAIFITLYYSIINIVKRYRFAVNRLFSLISITATLIALSLLFQLIFPDSPYLTFTGRAIFALLMIAAQLFFHFSQIFPRWEKRSPTWFIVLPILPGAVISFLTLLSDLIIYEAKYTGSLNYTFGKFFILYVSCLGIFIFGTFIILLYKSRHMENESFKTQLFYMHQGTNMAGAVIIIFFFLFPIVFKIYEYMNIGLIASGIILLSVINYSITEERVIDFKQFYLKNLYWITISTFLFVPVYLLLYYRGMLVVRGQEIPTAIITLVIFIFLFLFFRIFRSRIERLFRREHLKFERNVNEFFEELAELENPEAGGQYLDIFLNSTINNLETRFDISKTSFYMYNATGKNFYCYNADEGVKLPQIDETSELIISLKMYGNLLAKSMIFTDERLKNYKEPLLKTFNELGIQVVLPLFNYEREMIGLLFLERLKNNKQYSYGLLSALELYRIQFELILINSLFMEEAKTTQIIKHDKIVVSSIKKKVKPKKLKQIDGIRLSSLYIDNSEYGGDYFDSVLISPNALCLFMANTSNFGVESAMLALELYTVLHAQPEKYQLPEQVLNTMNWVISTSRLSERYVQAYSIIFSSSSGELIYSNAAFNPLVLFDYGDDNFSELDTNGVPIGADRGFSYESKSIKTPTNSIGILYSDGFASALNKNGDNYSLGRIKDIIRLKKDETPAVLTRMIYTDLKNFAGETKLINDISLIIFRIV